MKKWLPFFLLGSSLLAGCAMERIRLQERCRPDISLPPSARRVAIIDRCRFYKTQTLVFSNTAGRLPKQTLQYNYGVLPALQSLCETWQHMQLADSLFVPYGVELRGSDDIWKDPDKLNWGQVDSLCKQLRADVLVVLENYRALRELVLGKSAVFPAANPGADESGAGGGEPKNDFYRFEIRTRWRIYDPAGRSVRSDLTVISTTSIYVNDYYTSFSDYEKQAGETAGNSVAAYAMPREKAVERSYYRKGSNGIRKGAGLAQNGNWTAAAAEWRRHTESRRKKTAARACLNMAVTCERSGRLALAREWAKKSADKGNDRARKYLLDLETVEAVTDIGK